jgi:hypothetical protein
MRGVVMAMRSHVGFSVEKSADFEAEVLSHFSGLGYRVVSPRPNQWVFHRGSKLATLWRFDIRAYDTTLTVRSSPPQDGKQWISCDWEVYTFMNVITGGDVATLEAEGRALESVLKLKA